MEGEAEGVLAPFVEDGLKIPHVLATAL